MSKKLVKISRPTPEIAMKLLRKSQCYSANIKGIGYHNNKKFALKAIKEGINVYPDLTNRLKNDFEILEQTIKKISYFIHGYSNSIPKKFLEQQNILEIFFNSRSSGGIDILSTFSPKLHTKENIFKALKITEDPLRTIYRKYKFFNTTYPLINSKGKKISMMSKYGSVLMDKEKKKEALKFSPAAAFNFFLNKELSKDEFADIFVYHFLTKTRKRFFEKRVGPSCYCHACYGLPWKKYAPLRSKKLKNLQVKILDKILEKTKSLHMLASFLKYNESFDIPFFHKKIAKELKVKDKRPSLLINIKDEYFDYETQGFVAEALSKIPSSDMSDAKYFAKKILQRLYDGDPNFPLRDALKDNADVLEIAKAKARIYGTPKTNCSLKPHKSELVVSKAFVNEILPAFEKSWGESFIIEEVFLAEIAAEYINKYKDFKTLKRIIYLQSRAIRNIGEHALFDSLNIFSLISDEMKTQDIIDYYVIANHESFLPFYETHTGKIYRLGRAISKHITFSTDRKFYTQLVNTVGVQVFNNNNNYCYIPLSYRDNKEFMINAVAKSYKAIKYGSEGIRSDPDVLKIAYLRSSNAFKFASIKLKKDKDFLNKFFNGDPVAKFCNAHFTLKTHKDICVPALKNNIFLAETLSNKMILKLNMRWFNPTQRAYIFNEFIQRVDPDILILAKYKKHFLLKPMKVPATNDSEPTDHSVSSFYTKDIVYNNEVIKNIQGYLEDGIPF